ncbi:MAG: hypothetical protein J1E40_04805 [Oscillospiraceae bacterium]|nr:hypothetical protein [Oscillospiraceae bacterium]
MKIKDYNRLLTLQLGELLAETGFKVRKTSCLYRKVNRCVQYLFVYFKKDKYSSEESYTLSCSLAFQYVRADKLVCHFCNYFDAPRWATGFIPFINVIPGHDVMWEKYCPDLSIEDYAEFIAQDFIKYSSSFYDKFNSLEKLEAYFDLYPDGDENEEFHFMQRDDFSNGRACLIAAVLFILKRWDKLKSFLDTNKKLTEDEKKRILEYMEEYRKPKTINRVKW